MLRLSALCGASWWEGTPLVTKEQDGAGWVGRWDHGAAGGLLLLLNWVRATPDRPFMSSKSSSQTRLIGQQWLQHTGGRQGHTAVR